MRFFTEDEVRAAIMEARIYEEPLKVLCEKLGLQWDEWNESGEV